MRRERLWYKLATVLVALLIVGTIRSLIPEFLPNESPRSLGGDGVITLDDMKVELVDAQLARSVTDPLNQIRYDSDDVLVVLRVRVQATAGRVNPTYRLEGRDGTAYQHFYDGIAEHSILAPIQPATLAHRTLIFELPELDATNLELRVLNPQLGRVVPMMSTAVFALGDLGEPSANVVATPDDEVLADG